MAGDASLRNRATLSGMELRADAAAVIAFRDGAAFEAWLDEHADLQAGVWLKLAKKASGIASLTSDEAVPLPRSGRPAQRPGVSR